MKACAARLLVALLGVTVAQIAGSPPAPNGYQAYSETGCSSAFQISSSIGTEFENCTDTCNGQPECVSFVHKSGGQCFLYRQCQQVCTRATNTYQSTLYVKTAAPPPPPYQPFVSDFVDVADTACPSRFQVSALTGATEGLNDVTDCASACRTRPLHCVSFSWEACTCTLFASCNATIDQVASNGHTLCTHAGARTLE